MDNFINNKDLTRKLNYILKELGMNKKQFQEECQKYNPSISKPTILNLFNGNNTTTPTLQTLQTVIKVCRHSGNEDLKRVSLDYLLNDGVEEIDAKNNQIFQELGLTDDVINNLKMFNTDFEPLNRIDIVNFYLWHHGSGYWKYLDMLKKSYELRKYVNEKNKKEIEKVLDTTWLECYLRTFYKELLELIKKEIYNDKYGVETINKRIDIVIEYLKFKILKYDKQFLDNIEDIV